jgi:uncharacterized protein
MTKQKKIWAGILAAIVIVMASVFWAAWHFSSAILFPEVAWDPIYVKNGDPSVWGLAFENITFPTPDGLTLNGWYMPADNSRKVIILVHGHGATLHEGMKYAPALHKAGYNVIAFNLRRNLGNPGEGETGEHFATMGCLEKNDIIGAVDFAADMKGQKAIGVLGFSMGSASSILAMAEDRRIDAGVFNSAFAGIEDEIADVARRDYHIPRYPLIPFVVWIAGLRAGTSFYKCSAIDYIGKISPRPVFIMHCKGDKYVELSHGQRLFAAAKEPKEMWIAPCTEHVEEWNQCRSEAERRVLGFFDRTLKTRGGGE